MGRLLTKFSWTDKNQLIIIIVSLRSCSKMRQATIKKGKEKEKK